MQRGEEGGSLVCMGVQRGVGVFLLLFFTFITL